MTSNTVPAQTLLEGLIKFRHNKKWKSRWAIVSKLSPIADCLCISLHRNYREKIKSNCPKTRIALEGYVGIESCFTLDKESNTLAIICKSLTVIFSFDTREILHQWQSKLQENFCKEKHYLVHLISIPPKSKLTCGPARLLLQDFGFGLVSGIPPRLLDYWAMEQLRRFGNVDGKLCFEGGSKCGKGAGLHVLYSNQSAEISKYFELASNGQLNSLLEQTNANEKYFSITNNDFLYNSKYQNVINGNLNNGSGQKTTGSDSSTWDSCSQILNLSALDENSPSNGLYLNQGRPTCEFYHSSINLNCKSHYCGSIESGACGNQDHCNRKGSSFTASDSYNCQSSSNLALFNSTTISRSSNVKCDLTNCVTQPRTHCHQVLSHHPRPHPHPHLHPHSHQQQQQSHPQFASATINRCGSVARQPVSSPSTSSLVPCPPIGSDRESLFSQSSHGSSNSSSGCSTNSSSVTYNCSNQLTNHNCCHYAPYAKADKSRPHHCDEPEHQNCKSDDYSFISQLTCQCYLAPSKEDVNQDVFTGDHKEADNGRQSQTSPLMSPQQSLVQQSAEQMDGHLYSQVNFMNKNAINTRHTNSNYDIPKKMMLVAALCPNKPRQVSQKKLSISHCNCDTKQLDADICQQSRKLCCHKATLAADRFKSTTTTASDRVSCQSTLLNGCGHDNEASLLRCPCNEQTHCKQADHLSEHELNGEYLNTLRPNRHHHAPYQIQLNGQVHCGQRPNEKCDGYKSEHNYENMHFIKTINLYENMCFAPNNSPDLNGFSKCNNTNESVQQDKECSNTIQESGLFLNATAIPNSLVESASDCPNNRDHNSGTKCDQELLANVVVGESTCPLKEDRVDPNGTGYTKSMDYTGNCSANNNNWTNISEGDGTTSISDNCDTTGQQACHKQTNPIHLGGKLCSQTGLNEQRENNSLSACTNRSTELPENGEDEMETGTENGDDNDSLGESSENDGEGDDCNGNDNAQCAHCVSHCTAHCSAVLHTDTNQRKLTLSLLSLNNRADEANYDSTADSGALPGETKNYQMKMQTMSPATEDKSSVTNLISSTKQAKYDCRKSAMLREKSFSIDDISSIESLKLSNMMMMINIYGSSDNKQSSANETANGSKGHNRCVHYRNNHTHKSDQLLHVIKHNHANRFEWSEIRNKPCSTDSDEDDDFCNSSQNTIFSQNPI